MGCAATVVLLIRNRDELCLAQVGKTEVLIVRGEQQIKVFQECNGVDFAWCGSPPYGWPTPPERAMERLMVNCLGGRDFFDPSISFFKVRPGDSILLLSDGITEKITEEEIHRLVSDCTGEAVVRELVRLGKERGGEDNLTAVFCRFGDSAGADSEVPISQDLKVVRVQFTQENELGRYITDALKCCIRHGYFDMAKRIADSAPEDAHREFLLGLLAEAGFPRRRSGFHTAG